MALLKEQEGICRQLGSVDGLATSLANQASVMHQMGRAREGLPLAEEAYRLATTHGYTGLARQIEPILNNLRQPSAIPDQGHAGAGSGLMAKGKIRARVRMLVFWFMWLAVMVGVFLLRKVSRWFGLLSVPMIVIGLFVLATLLSPKFSKRVLAAAEEAKRASKQE
jgi:hypothetical protein